MIGLSYWHQKPLIECECLITKAGTSDTKIWAKWLPNEDAFINARGDLIHLDETATWELLKEEV